MNDLYYYAAATTADAYTVRFDYVTQAELNIILEKFSSKIYELLKNNGKIDIAEDDFIKLLKEGVYR